MKIKLNLRQINDVYKTISTQERNKTVSLSSCSEDKVLIYDYNQKDLVLQLKFEIGKCINECADSIELWYRGNDNDINNKDKGALIELSDIDLISSTILQNKSVNPVLNKTIVEDSNEEDEKEEGKKQEQQSEKSHDDNNDIILLYYKLNLYPIHIMIDFYQNKIEKINLTVSSSCSIYMLKHRIEEKFIKANPTMLKINQRLFGISLKNKSNSLDIKLAVNKEFDNKSKLTSIIKEFESTQSVSFGPLDLIHITFLLVLNSKATLKMGINFNFNYFKNLSKVNFNTNAPTYRECSDGLNMFVYCRNSQCNIYNEMFVRNIGYGCFDIIREAMKTKCPYCKSSSLVEVRNIGMINASWAYNGLLNNKKTSCFEGDGATIINDRLYSLSEVKISNVFAKLLIKIKPHKSKNDDKSKDNKESKVKVKGVKVDESSSLFDSIPLCLDKKYYNQGSYINTESNGDSRKDCKDINDSDCNCNSQVGDKQIESHGNLIIDNRKIRTDLDDKGAYCMNGCLLKTGFASLTSSSTTPSTSSSSDTACFIF